MFWLGGSIRISPRQQVEFLHRLDTGASPFAPAVVEEFFANVMVAQPRDGGAAIRAKTGTASASDLTDTSTAGFEGTLGWYVGIVDRPSKPSAYFAMVLFTPEPWPEGFREDRIALTDVLLAELGYL
jgi:beta-lactamase class D